MQAAQICSHNLVDLARRSFADDTIYQSSRPIWDDEAWYCTSFLQMASNLNQDWISELQTRGLWCLDFLCYFRCRIPLLYLCLQVTRLDPPANSSLSHRAHQEVLEEARSSRHGELTSDWEWHLHLDGCRTRCRTYLRWSSNSFLCPEIDNTSYWGLVKGVLRVNHSSLRHLLALHLNT